jgi:hypothetical protein
LFDPLAAFDTCFSSGDSFQMAICALHRVAMTVVTIKARSLSRSRRVEASPSRLFELRVFGVHWQRKRAQPHPCAFGTDTTEN